jgi:hypothetical protein
VIHPRTREYLRKTPHTCNAYCVKESNRHADIARSNKEYTLDEIKDSIHLVYPDETRIVLDVREAPESSEYTNEGEGPYKNRWLVIWEVTDE